MSWLFVSGGQSIGASASALILPMNIQGWELQPQGYFLIKKKMPDRSFRTAPLNNLRERPEEASLVSKSKSWVSQVCDLHPDLSPTRRSIVKWGAGC